MVRVGTIGASLGSYVVSVWRYRPAVHECTSTGIQMHFLAD